MCDPDWALPLERSEELLKQIQQEVQNMHADYDLVFEESCYDNVVYCDMTVKELAQIVADHVVHQRAARRLRE